jgi:hypothetical protein
MNTKKTESITALPELGFYHEAGGRGLLTAHDTDIVARDVQVFHARAIAHRCNSYPALVEALEAVSRLACLEEYRAIHAKVEAALQLAREGGDE